MVRFILTLVTLSFTMVVSAQKINTKKIKIHYAEYHPQKSLSTSGDNIESLNHYITTFQQKENITISSIYSYPTSEDSYAYYFDLSNLTEYEIVKFIEGRIGELDSFNKRSILTMFKNKPKTLETYLMGIDGKNNIDQLSIMSK